MKSLVVIAPIAVWPSLVSMNLALGYAAGGGVPLSADGNEPATHLGLHTWASDEFIAIATGVVTPEIEGVTPEEIAGLLAAITVSVQPEVNEVVLTKSAHYNHVAAGLGLVRITAELG